MSTHHCAIAAGRALVLLAMTVPSSAAWAANPLPSPQASGYLRALVNVNQAVPFYTNMLGPEVLVTDLYVYKPLNTPITTYPEIRNWLAARLPAAQIGVYCSSRVVAPAATQEYSPPNSLTPEGFAESELLPPKFLDHGRRIVDFRQPAARSKLIAGLVAHARTYQARWLYADNWSHPATWSGYIAWKHSLAYMRELRAALAAHGIGLICNVAIDLTGVSATDVKGLGAACDAVSLEMWASPAATKDAKRLAKLIKQYQTLQATGCGVILMPQNSTLKQARAEGRFAAGMAMVLDGPWVSFSFWDEPQDWFVWPSQLGQPTGEVKVSGTKVFRYYERGTVQIEGGKRTATVTFKRFYGSTNMRSLPAQRIARDDRRLCDGAWRTSRR